MGYVNYRFRMKPSKPERDQLGPQLDGTRFIWNHMLELNKDTYAGTGKFVFYNQMQNMLPDMKKQKKYEFLKRVPSQALQAKIQDLETAIKNVWKQGNGFPKFKSRKTEYDSMRIPQNTAHTQIKFAHNRVKLPKIDSWIKINRHRQFPEGAVLKSVTVIREHGIYYLSCLLEVQNEVPRIQEVDPADVVGLDLGIKVFAMSSDGEIHESRKFFRRGQKKLKKLQRRLAKKQKGSKNRAKARAKVRKQHAKIRNQRKDHLEKLSTQIANEYQVVVLEDLAVRNMVKNRKLAKSISDQGWSMFGSMLEYKTKDRGGFVVRIDRYAPSTKTCSRCGAKRCISLDERTYSCAHCGLVMDRDLNAALNIKEFGLAMLRRAGTVRTSTGAILPQSEGLSEVGVSSPLMQELPFSSGNGAGAVREAAISLGSR